MAIPNSKWKIWLGMTFTNIRVLMEKCVEYIEQKEINYSVVSVDGSSIPLPLTNCIKI
jgi:hypothetical protein